MSRKSDSDTPEPFTIAAPEPRRPSGRAILLAGVAGACVLGVGLGLWARPGMHERQAALTAPVKAAPPAPAAAQQLEIVVDEHPRAAGAPIDVLAPTATPQPAPAAAAPPAPAIPRTLPTAPPEGLMRTRDTASPAVPPHEASPLKTMLPAIAAAFTGARIVLTKLEHPAPAVVAAPAPPPPEPRETHKAELAKAQARQLEIARADAARAQAHRAALAKAAFEAERLQQAKAERDAQLADAAAEKAEAAKVAAAQAQAHKLALAKAAAARAEARKLALAKAAAARVEAHKEALAKAEAAKAEGHRQALARAEAAKAHKIELAREAQAEKAQQRKLAMAEARAQAAQREEARLEALADAAEAKKRHQLTRLAHALAHAVMGRDRAAPVEEAREDRKHAHSVRDAQAQVQQASLKSRRRHEAARLAATAHRRRPQPEPAAPQPAASGLMRVSTPARCASRDPGEAMVCADPGLSAAERQLSRAYQGARNAGVPDAQLQQGQQRWLAARSAAAREAPWAVRDVYMARIAELNGQAKEAQGGY